MTKGKVKQAGAGQNSSRKQGWSKDQGQGKGQGQGQGKGRGQGKDQGQGQGKDRGQGKDQGQDESRSQGPGQSRQPAPSVAKLAGRPPAAGSTKAADRRTMPSPTEQARQPMPNLAEQARSLPEDLLYGRNPVREALRKGRPITRLWLSRDEQDRLAAEIIGYCRQANIPYKSVDRPYLDRLCCGMAHQGFAAQAAPKEYVPWTDMVALATAKGEVPLLVLLDEVEDPHNLGAVLRSVDALGAHGAVIPKHRAVPLTGGVAKASAGAWEYVPVDRVTNLCRTIEEMKAAGFWVMGAAAAAPQTIYDTDWQGPVALVLGGEDKGLSRLVEKNCDVLVSIPMAGQINSLNVSAAAAIILAEIQRQRSKKGLPKG